MSAINLGSGGSKKLIDEILGQIHDHDNILVLDDLDDSNGILTYKGKEIITSGGDSTILATQVIETEDRKFLSKKEKDSLAGINGNIQAQIDALNMKAASGLKYRGRFDNYGQMTNSISDPETNDMVFIDKDENFKNVSTIYVFNNGWKLAKKDNEATNGWVASNNPPVSKEQLWIDTSDTKPVLKWFDSSSWIEISGSIDEILASDVTQETDLRFVNDLMLSILSKMNVDPDSGKLMFNDEIIGSGQGSSIIDDVNIAIDKTYSSLQITNLLKDKQDSLGYIPENLSNKGVANGYVPLDSNTKIDNKFLPEIVTQKTFVVNNLEERDAITEMIEGDFCLVSSDLKLYIYETSEWVLISDGIKASINIKNNLTAINDPTIHDDSTAGYVISSMWINTASKKAFICTSAEKDNAQWEQMAGSVTLNIGEVIPFKVDNLNMLEEDGVFLYKIPSMDLKADFMELTLNGHELIQDLQYELENRTLEDSSIETYVKLTKKLTDSDYLYGEVYKHDLKNAEEQMTKLEYDSNRDGKVNAADVADKVKGLFEWESKREYKKNDVILRNKEMLIANKDFTSGVSLNTSNWNSLYAMPLTLKEFNTSNLEPTSTRGYVTSTQISNINTIPSLTNTVNTNKSNISTLFSRVSQNTSDISRNRNNISDLYSKHNQLSSKVSSLKFTSLTDTPSTLVPNATVRVSQDGKKIILDTNPVYPIKKITDCNGTVTTFIHDLKFDNMIRTGFDQNTGVLSLSANLLSKDIIDMPKAHEHGKVLVSDVNNNKYVLADKEELTMSVENFTCDIAETDWTEIDGKLEKVIFHDMASEAVIVSFTDEFKFDDKSIRYEVLDKNNIKAYSNERKNIKCVINCALGAGNGYWQYLMDWSKIDFVDDSRIRTDRAYSSSKLENMLKSYALKNDYYTKSVSDSRYAVKELEHDHLNKDIIDKFTIENNRLKYDNVEILTEIIPKMFSISKEGLNESLMPIFEVEQLLIDENIQGIIASEVVIQNTGETNLSLEIYDDYFRVLSIELKPEEVQKYHLGVSSKNRILAKGNYNAKISFTSF